MKCCIRSLSRAAATGAWARVVVAALVLLPLASTVQAEASIPHKAPGPVFPPVVMRTYAAAHGPSFAISAPQQVQIGQPITVTIGARDVADVAGYEVTLAFDQGVAHLSGLLQRNDDLHRFGRDVEPLGPVSVREGVAFGLYSCPVTDCVHATRGPRTTSGAHGSVTLGRVVLIADHVGVLQLRLTDTQAVNATGTPVALGEADPILTVTVGGADSPFYAAPTVPVLTPKTPTAPAGPFNATGDQVVSHGDAVDVALAWTAARQFGAVCPGPTHAVGDVNHDGCLDVGDVQAVAAHYGMHPPASASVPVPMRRPGLAAPLRRASAVTSAGPLTFMVNSTADDDDANPGDGICADASGNCTLRAAMTEANLHPGPDTINFNIPGSGVHTIQLQNTLPEMSDTSGGTTIDGYTQPGASPNSDLVVDNARIGVQLVWTGQQGQDAIHISSANNVVRGLAIDDVARPFLLYGFGANHNVIAGDFIGTDATGTFASANHIFAGNGVDLAQGANYNTVGGTAVADRDVISGNGQNGIATYDEGTDHNAFFNNLIGLSPDGTRRVANYSHGIDINGYSSYNLLGGTALGQRNVVSGNGGEGIELSHGELTVGNLVEGNYVGTDVTGNTAYPYTADGYNGIHLEDGIRDNVVAYNVVGNSGGDCCNKGGITIEGIDYAEGNHVYHNWVGVSPSGTPIANTNWGVGIYGDAAYNTIGPDNVIADNPIGVYVQDATAVYNTITRNSIFGNSGLGIDLAPTGENANQPGPANGPNDKLNHPVLNTATSGYVTGTACVTCTVEIFVADGGAGSYGQGKTFMGGAAVNADGTFTVALTSTVPQGAYVTASATDAAGDTSEFSQNIAIGAPSGTPPATAPPTAANCTNVVAADTFGRVVGNDDWGRADIGGVWGLDKVVEPAQDNKSFAVNGATGTMALSTTASLGAAYLADVSVQDVDIRARMTLDKFPSGEDVYAGLAARHVTGGSEYRARIALTGQGTVSVRAERTLNDGQYDIGSDAATSATWSPGHYVWARMQVTGANPTTIRIKAWSDGQSEPSNWQYTATDNTSYLQAAGNIGLVGTLGSTVSNVPITVSFDDLQATDLGASPCTPSATATTTPSATTAPSAKATTAPSATATTAPSATATTTPSATATTTPSATATTAPSATATSSPIGTPTGTGTTLASDSFARTVTSGWGSADVGGPYTLSGSAADFAVNGATGSMALTVPATNLAAYLGNVLASDVDERVRLQADKLAAGGSEFVYELARSNVTGVSEYRGKLRIDPSGQAYLQATKVLTNAETGLGSEVAVPGLAYTAGEKLWLRLQVVGTNPTTLQMMTWADGQPEPTGWQVSVTDSESSLQMAGAIGLRAYLGGKATNAPVTVGFNAYSASAPGSGPAATATPPTGPSATATPPTGPSATATPSSSSTNLLANGSFETTGSGWLKPWSFLTRSGATGTITQDTSTAENGAASARITISQSNSQQYYVQLQQGGLSLTAGRSYALSFYAKASVNRTIQVAVQQVSSPYALHAVQDENLTTGWQHFLVAVPVTATDTNGGVEFNLASATGQVWLDNVSLTPQ